MFHWAVVLVWLIFAVVLTIVVSVPWWGIAICVILGCFFLFIFCARLGLFGSRLRKWAKEQEEKYDRDHPSDPYDI